ncbi:hypothetical protein [Haliea sp. E17]|uniref:hypothetical protein n=1 Tax=Haliea sp. E17 TaxID=3401576 RepID=UPI003AABE306
MFFRKTKEAPVRITFWKALRHLVAFQIKLAADALRDLIMSPLSIVVFCIDALTSPTLESSLYLRLMVFGRKTDRYINLFDEYKDKGHATMDEAIETLEAMANDLAADPSRKRRE